MGTEADLKALNAELAQLRKDFARVVETLERTVEHGGEEILTRARTTAEDARDEAGRAVHAVREEFRRKPLASIFSVFAVGLILGLLFSGRR